jgi:hypothetical protein
VIEYLSNAPDIRDINELTFKNDDHEPLFCGATAAPSSLDEDAMVMEDWQQAVRK